MSDAGTRLLFKLRSGTYEFYEEFGRHRDREGVCVICAVKTVKVRSLFVVLPRLFRDGQFIIFTTFKKEFRERV